jgi:hypothetical protein
MSLVAMAFGLVAIAFGLVPMAFDLGAMATAPLSLASFDAPTIGPPGAPKARGSCRNPSEAMR